MSEYSPSQIEKYTSHIASLIGLGDWIFTYAHVDHTARGIHADVSCTAEAKLAHMRFDNDFGTEGSDTISRIVCHELFHCQLAGVDQWARGFINHSHSVKKDQKYFYDEYCIREEEAVYDVARWLTGLVPTIEAWVKSNAPRRVHSKSS